MFEFGSMVKPVSNDPGWRRDDPELAILDNTSDFDHL